MPFVRRFRRPPAGLAPFGWPVYRLHQELIGLRRRHPWLHRAQSRVVEIHNTDLVLEAFAGERRLWLALNIADSAVIRTIAAGADKLAGNGDIKRKSGSTEIALPPHGWAVLS